MAKLFYSLEEAAQRLGKSPDEVKAMVADGQLQEFRDRDRLMFKVDQVELLAGGADEEHSSGLAGSGLGGSSFIPLAGSGEMEAISLASDSGSAMNLESPKEQTGISIFDAESTETADPSAVTQVTETSTSELALETVGSGSGLLDLTREADDTSLGQDLLEEVSVTQTEVTETIGDAPSALFESTGAESDVGVAAGAGAVAMVPAAALAEPYDGTWSGITGGVALGMTLLLALVLTLVVFGLSGAVGAPLVTMIGDNFWMWVGIGAGVVAICGIVGMVLGKRA